jgi:membrane protein YdbS with pleckstrin-like domain
LIVAYAALLALFDLFVLLPGNPYSGVWEFFAAVGVQTLVVWRLWHGSSISWLLAMAFAAGQALTTLLMQPPLEVGVILTFVLAIAQAAILCLYAYVRSRPLSWPEGTSPEPLGQ